MASLSLYCNACGGEGRKYTSRHGGNDPDVIDAGKCESCNGSGNQKCDRRGCNENAIAFNDDGEALCDGCLAEWQISEFGDDA